MQDKRIKQITTEMFTAWGLICIVLVMVDDVGQFSNSHYSHFSGFSLFAEKLILYSCMGSIIVPMKFFVFFSIGNVPVVVFWGVVTIIQIALYWYLGNLTGRFIVWCRRNMKSKHKMNDK